MANARYYGDNLKVLREHIADASVDLIYLDPPFNSNATYNVLFRSHSGEAAAAQIQAFDDTWHWNQQTEKLFVSMIGGGVSPTGCGRADRDAELARHQRRERLPRDDDRAPCGAAPGAEADRKPLPAL